MKKLHLVIVLIVFLVPTVFAQIDINKKSEDDLITIAENEGFIGTLEQQLNNLKNNPGQAAVIKQIGNHNLALIKQSGTNQFAYILQDGNYLDTSILLQGSNNNAVIKQRGDHLITDVKLTGYSNDFKLLQKGSNLRNNIKLLNVAGTNLLMLQTEDRFLYFQSGNGNGIPLIIETTQSVPVIIVTNN